jgi:malate permease and related proteins
MSDFVDLFSKILPLYVIVGLGYVLAKRTKIDRDSIASVLIYIIAPIVIFNGVASAPSESKYLLLPLLTFVVACVISSSYFWASKRYFSGVERNLMGFMSGTGNTGYFGLPVILALYGTGAQNIAILATLGFVLFENTLGFYYIARHDLTPEKAIEKVLKLPALYAYCLGVLVNFVGYHPTKIIVDYIVYFRGAYVIFGMMIIGVGLSQVSRSAVDKKLLAASFSAKFLVFPAAIGLVGYANSRLKVYDPLVIKVLLVLSITPIASNTVAFATKLKVHPEKAVFTVLASTIFALIYIPIFVNIFLK